MFPLPIWSFITGYVRNYTIGDVFRYQRTNGKKNVLQPIGWDVSGLLEEGVRH